MPDWMNRQTELAAFAARQLFFIGGAPRSGTTWLQQILDAHPEVSCQGEGLFWKHLAVPMENMMAARRQALVEKNTAIFQHTGGYKLPGDEDTEHLIGTAILLALQRQCAGKTCKAIGEKTPENVFFFPRLKQLFPGAKFIGLMRDPRDVLASAWHFFRAGGAEDDAAKFAFIQSALPSLNAGTRQMLALAQEFPSDSAVVTYEGLRTSPAPIIASLFRLIGVADDEEVVQNCLTQTAFATQTSGRAAGSTSNGAFLRSGVAGTWRTTISPAMNELILHELNWMFPHFGWDA